MHLFFKQANKLPLFTNERSGTLKSDVKILRDHEATRVNVPDKLNCVSNERKF